MGVDLPGTKKGKHIFIVCMGAFAFFLYLNFFFNFLREIVLRGGVSTVLTTHQLGRIEILDYFPQYDGNIWLLQRHHWQCNLVPLRHPNRCPSELHLRWHLHLNLHHIFFPEPSQLCAPLHTATLYTFCTLHNLSCVRLSNQLGQVNPSILWGKKRKKKYFVKKIIYFKKFLFVT